MHEVGRPRLLVVDDDARLASQLARFFEGRGFEAQICPDGHRGLETALGMPADAVLLDARMPGMDGYEVCRRLRAAGFAAPIIILSGYDTEWDVILAYGAGADDHVSKTTAPAVLLAKIERAIEREARRSSTPLAGGAQQDSGIPPATPPGGLGIRDLLRRCCPAGHAAARIGLTRLEEHILITLGNAQGAIVPAEWLLEEGWGAGSAGPGRLHQAIAGLRRKVEPLGWQISNVRGRGYRLEGDWAGQQLSEKTQTPDRNPDKKIG